MGKKTNTVIVNFLLVPPKPGLFPGVGSKAGRQGYCIAGRAGKKTGAHLVKTQENSLVGSPPPHSQPCPPRASLSYGSALLPQWWSAHILRPQEKTSFSGCRKKKEEPGGTKNMGVTHTIFLHFSLTILPLRQAIMPRTEQQRERLKLL